MGRAVLLFLPLVAINLILIVLALRDWARRRAYRYFNRWVWLVLILFVQFLGPASYLTLGRSGERR
jgi:uncharacterized membrane protein YphA (DoxX/SURF4 family)